MVTFEDSIINLIISGGIGVVPTDTLYGLVASANNEQAVKRLYSLKNREKKPGTLIASSIEQLVDLGLKKRYLTAVAQYWPNSISVVIPTDSRLEYLHQGQKSLAVRLPADVNLIDLLNKTGPLITTSANLPGEEPSTNISEAKKYYGDKVDFYVDGGRLNVVPSTVIRVIDDAIEILRQGKVKINEKGEIIKK